MKQPTKKVESEEEFVEALSDKTLGVKRAEECEKCGAETRVELIGDESYNRCPECGWITH